VLVVLVISMIMIVIMIMIMIVIVIMIMNMIMIAASDLRSLKSNICVSIHHYEWRGTNYSIL
jgi:hypothetical protein